MRDSQDGSIQFSGTSLLRTRRSSFRLSGTGRFNKSIRPQSRKSIDDRLALLAYALKALKILCSSSSNSMTVAKSDRRSRLSRVFCSEYAACMSELDINALKSIRAALMRTHSTGRSTKRPNPGSSAVDRLKLVSTSADFPSAQASSKICMSRSLSIESYRRS